MRRDCTSADQTVRWEILPGLPGHGPAPYQFHLGHPTPWTEGLVVRFWKIGGGEWIGNFQHDASMRTDVVHWPEANSVAVSAGDCFYLVDAGNPDDYSFVGPRCIGGSATFNEDRTTLFVADDYGVQAYGTDRKLLWKSSALGGYIISIGDCVGRLLPIEVEKEMGEPLVTVRLSADDGSLVETRYDNFILS